jgi:hypothetical protein
VGFLIWAFAIASGVGTYAYAKTRDVSDGKSAAAGALAGAGTGAALSVLISLWPLFLLGGVGVYLNRRHQSRKALPPGSS